MLFDLTDRYLIIKYNGKWSHQIPNIIRPHASQSIIRYNLLHLSQLFGRAFGIYKLLNWLITFKIFKTS
jgi:hypothetical protein